MRQPRHPGKSRRTFLKSAGAAAMAPWAFRIIPASALGADGATPPSNRIALGLIGVGMVGQGHLRGFLHEPEAQVVAVCDVDRWRRENAQATTEQAYADRRTSGAYRGCAAYNDLRDLLARDDIDAVFIGTGDRWHARGHGDGRQGGKGHLRREAHLPDDRRGPGDGRGRAPLRPRLPVRPPAAIDARVPPRLPVGPRRGARQDPGGVRQRPGHEQRRSTCRPNRSPTASTGTCGSGRPRGGRSTTASSTWGSR